jgi:polar amino acid transport system substrate-binding protein
MKSVDLSGTGRCSDQRGIRRLRYSVMIIYLILLFLAGPSEAAPDTQDQSDVLVVDVFVNPPMVMKNEKGEFYGFDIDLWEAIAKELNLTYRYREIPLATIFSDIETGNADVGFSGISITSEREERVDFSTHYFDSGLLILVRKSRDLDIMAALNAILTRQNVKIVLSFFIIILFFSHLFWLIEKRSGQISESYLKGTSEASYWAVVTSATVGFGDIVPKTFSGRLMTFVLIFFGVAFFGYIQAQMSSTFTLQKLESRISNHKHLSGKLVATLKDTTSVKALKHLGANIVEVEDMKKAFDKLLKKEVEAVVFDAPDILYYAKNAERGKVAVTGELFDKQYYGIAFHTGSKLREDVNRVLLKFRENGLLHEIQQRWFD